MRVLVDTSVWSLALRRSQPSNNQWVSELAELIDEQRVVMVGPIRQELLSGIRNPRQFATLREHLQAFPDLQLSPADYEQAAEFFNLCRSKGVQGSNTDFLICAAAVRRKLAIYATDGDFRRYAKLLNLELHEPRA